MKIPALFSVFLCFALTTLPATAALKIYGGSKFQFGSGGTTVTFGCGGINNPSKENATGTILVSLWALQSPYRGGTLSGKMLASYKLDGLNPGSYYSPVNRTVAASLPSPRQSYYICLAVSEYRSGGFSVSDYRNFDETEVLGPVPTELFSMSGPWTWRSQPEGGIIDFTVARISHNRPGATGTLKLAVWATREPYRGGPLTGYELGNVVKKALQPGYTYNDVKQTAKYQRPPAGTYYISLVLAEYDGSVYRTVAHLPASQTSTFK